ncbi:hypothetical protein [Variovorax sp. KK3]|uniref:hypothetical protein n=1 Tax=Variovorax sp. KK3 TaxID=1855728 RepID=UPI00097BA88C|nr:hypothetical protein [Variovorax sp. KK3]
MSRIWIACLLMFSGAGAHAACDTGLAERMHAKLHPDRTLDHERAVCQPWRGVKDRSIVVLPLPLPSSVSGFKRYDLDVLVVQLADNGNSERAAIVSRLYEPDALREYDVRIQAIKVDTTRYVLAEDVRAFGLRIARQSVSQANPYANETLSLYVPQGPKLAKVIDGLEMVLERGEWGDSCTGSFETVRGSLAVARASGKGYADLQLRQSRSESLSSAQGGQCITDERPATFATQTFRYDGSAYRAAKGSTPD